MFIIGVQPVCLKCKHFNFDSEGATCSAFPLGIPQDIYINGDEHKSPHAEQENKSILFEQASPKELAKRGINEN